MASSNQLFKIVEVRGALHAWCIRLYCLCVSTVLGISNPLPLDGCGIWNWRASQYRWIPQEKETETY